MKQFSALITGLLFGTGLLLSGMSDPKKVIAFLDILGEWDPTLFIVMVSALTITLPAFRFILQKDKPLFADMFSLPEVKSIDKRLIIGASLFGIGWGLYGYCPGPAIVSLSSLNTDSLLFVAAMAAGMKVAEKTPPALFMRR